MIFAVMFLFTAGGIALPGVPGPLLSKAGERGASGRSCRGRWSALTSLTEVVGADRRHERLRRLAGFGPGPPPGLVWLVGAGLYVLCVPIILRQMGGRLGGCRRRCRPDLL